MASVTDSPWQTIISAALVGTERQPFQPPIADGQLGKVLAHLGDQPVEAALLSAAATVALHQRVGWLPEIRPVPPSPPCPSEDWPRCSPPAARCLHQILQGQYRFLLPEWLEQTTIAKQRVPEIDLPALLDKGRQQRELRAAILPVLGQRGQWLAAQNSDWHYAFPLTTDTDWETGEPAARLLFLQNLRSQDPDRARALLQSTWSQEPANDRAKFLETLQTRLSLADESFLEQALGDRSQEVRRVAFDLLASSAGSRLCKQITTHTCRYLAVENKTSLQVQLPDRLDETLIQLGIELKPSTAVNTKLGEKAWWLLQLIGATPLSIWTEQWQMPPQEIVALTRSHDWQMVVLDGLALAAKRQRNDEWLQAIFKLYMAGQASFRDAALIDLSIEALFKALSRDRQDALLIDLLQISDKPINDSLMIWLLRYSSQIWSLDLARLVLDRLEKHINTNSTLSNSDWELRSALKEFARFIPVILTSEIINWRSQLADERNWIQSIDDFVALLQFRQEMIQAFEMGNGN